MNTQLLNQLTELKDGQHHYFNWKSGSQGCVKVKGDLYTLHNIFGGQEYFMGSYTKDGLPALVELIMTLS